MHRTFTLVLPEGSSHDLEFSGDDGASVGRVRRAIGSTLLRDIDRLVADDAPLADDLPFGTVVPRNGMRIRADRIGPARPPAASVLSACVVAGPDAGRVVPVVPGRLVIGRGPGVALETADPDVSRLHAEILVSTEGISIRDLGSTNGTRVGDQDVGATAVPLGEAEPVRLGNSTVQLVSSSTRRLAVTPRPDGLLSVNRPPRVTDAPGARTIDLPDPPPPGLPQRIQWIAALLPAVLAAGLAMATHNLEFLAFAALGPLTMIGSSVADRLSNSRDRRRSGRRYRAASAEAAALLRSALDDERADRNRRFPNAAAVGRAAAGPAELLWARRRSDEDFLAVRLGTGDFPSFTRARRGTELLEPAELREVPATVDLRLGALGISGPRRLRRPVAGFVVGQLVALHSPVDAVLHVLVDDEESEWNWMRWLTGDGAAVAAVSVGGDEHTAHVEQIVRETQARRHARCDRWTGPWTVLVIDSSAALSVPGMTELLQDGGAVGVTAVVMADQEVLLPAGCRSVARTTGEHGESLLLSAASSEDRPSGPTRVHTDGVGRDWLDDLGRALAPLRDVGAEASEGIPRTVALSDLLPAQDIDAQTVLDRWRSADRVRVPLGQGPGGPVWIDLDQDGPHCLIAGSTGAGKSELLRCLITGLALSQPPDRITFVFIDYKGGAAFADSVGLPHTLAMVTDLDAHLTRRALDSLDAELRRREQLFAQAGVADLTTYRRHDLSRGEPLARLVLVVDEFASLADELPDFLDGLVSIAQRGRSLGVHLVLATQRPAGVVSPEIKANTALRIALRVTDPGESLDVIGDARAAAIAKDRPGRAVAVTASGLVEFQTAQASCAVLGSTAVRVRRLDGWNAVLPPRHPETGGTGFLAQVEQATRDAASAGGITAPPRPWLEPLPGRWEPGEAAREVPGCFALGDVPGRQAQPPVEFDPDSSGPTAFIGAPGSGRTSALRAVIAAAVTAVGDDGLQVHVIDFGGSLLRSVRGLHCAGSLLTRADAGYMSRLSERLRDELSRRRQVLAELGVSSAAQARAIGARLPAVLVVVDGWEAFVAASEECDAGAGVDELLALARDGGSAGIGVVLAGDRGLLSSRVFSVMSEKYLLAMTDPNDYGLAGVPRGAVPTSMPPGRAIRLRDAMEVQIGWVDPDVLPAGRRGPASDADPDPIVVRPLPHAIDLEQLTGHGAPSRCGHAVLGVGGDGAEAVAVELLESPGRFLVAGPARSGRSTALVTLASQALGDGLALLALAGSRSPVTRWAATAGVETIPTEAPQTDDGIAVWAMRAERAMEECELLVIDDLEDLTDSVVGDLVIAALKRRHLPVLASARSDELAVSFRGLGVELRRHRRGLLLAPGPADGDLLGVRVPRTNPFGQPQRPVPGRGILVTDGIREEHPDGLGVQVAMSVRSRGIS